MYAIMGITGQIGGVIARTLLAAKQPVRAIVRDAIKGQAWSDRGCEVALATIEDRASLATAFREAEGVFVLVPPSFDPLPEFPEAQAIDAHNIPASGLVHGELSLGCSSGARAGRDSEFPATARQAGANGGHSGYREGRSRTASGCVEWSSRD